MTYQPDDIVLNGDYRIEALIGEGAFGQVYRAMHLHLNVLRAIKVLSRDMPGVGSREFREIEGRFQLEAHLGARLSHRSLVQVHDFRRDGDTLALVMEYCPGKSLAHRLAQTRRDEMHMGVGEVVRLGLEVADGLSALHERDLVHRDLKPSNILFDAGGQAKVADLGLAQVPGGPSLRSQESLAAPHPGTPAYMSPEQRHTTDYLTPPSDIYTLGVVLFEALTLRSYPNQRPGTRLKTLRPDAPDWLDALVSRMLAEDPKRRPWDGAEVRELLRAGQRQMAAERQPPVKQSPPGAEIVPTSPVYPQAQPPAGAVSRTGRSGPSPAPVQAEALAIAPQSQASAAPVADTAAAQPGSAPLPSRAAAPGVEKTAAVSSPRPLETVKIGGKPLVGLGIVGGVLAACVVLALAGYWIWSILDGQVTPQPTAVVEIATELPQPVNTKRPTQPPATELPATEPPATVRPRATDTLRPTKPPPTESLSLLPADPQGGDTWMRPADGMAMIYIPPGEFLMGSADSDTQAYDDEKPQHTVYLDGYWIDRTEVTNAMFTAFVAATGHETTAEKEGSGYAWSESAGKWQDTDGADWQHPRGPDSSIDGMSNHPVVQVSWDDAVAYCEWVGGGLPTEAQWEKAARGADGRVYPWGNTFDGTRLNFCDENCPRSSKDSSVDDGWKYTAPVGSYPDGKSPHGLLDMAGNVWEWVLDWYKDTYYQDTAERNPTGPSSGEYRVLRGGSWGDGSRFVRSADRDWYVPTVRYDFNGFRCSR